MKKYRLHLKNNYTTYNDEYGTTYWKLYGHYHRVDGPAIVGSNGQRKFYYLHGRKHRHDGPAVDFSDGYKEWWLNGKLYLTKEEWFSKLTPEQQYNYLWNLDYE